MPLSPPLSPGHPLFADAAALLRRQMRDYALRALPQAGHHLLRKPPDAPVLVPASVAEPVPVAAVTDKAPPPGAVLRGEAGLRQVRAELGDCQRCPLCRGRTSIVFGRGQSDARLMFVGEAPGREEDIIGQPFVGEAGKLLDRMVAAMGLQRDAVYVANIVKCRPPRNRDPEPAEVSACEPFLRRQIAAVTPQVLVGLGRYAVQTLLGTSSRISRLRGTWHSYAGIDLMPTFHPAYLLRNPADKKLVWQDLQAVMARLQRGQNHAAGPAS